MKSRVRYFINGLFEKCCSLGMVCIISVVIIVVSFLVEIIFGDKSANHFISIIGFVGLFNWLFLLFWGRAKSYLFDRELAHFNFNRFVYLLILVISIPCSLYSLTICLPSEVFQNKALGCFNDSFINPFLNHGDFDSVFSKSIISLLGIFFLSGVLVSMLVSLINQKAERWKQGEVSYGFQVSNYRVVIGGHETAPSLIRQLVDKYVTDKVIVFTSRDIPSVRREVESCLDTEQKKERVVFYHGYRNSKSDLKKLDLERTNLKAVYILGESRVNGILGDSRVNGEDESSHDTLNMTCFHLLKDLREDELKGLRGEDKENSIDCYVFFEYQTTSIVFQKYARSSLCQSLRFIPYNLYELHAQKEIGWEACLGHPNVLPLDRFDHKAVDVDKHVHLVIIGMSKMGQALGLEAIRVCHYPNYAKSQMLFEYGDQHAAELMKKRRTKITFIDCQMEEALETFKCRYHRLLEEISWSYTDCKKHKKPVNYPRKADASWTMPDIELEFINGRLQSEDVSKYLLSAVNDETAVVTIASCLSRSNQSLALFLCLPKDVLEKAEIMVYQPDSTELVDSVELNRSAKKMKAFGQISQSVDLTHIEALESMSKRIFYVYCKRRNENHCQLEDFTVESMNDYLEKEGDNLKNGYWDKEETWRWANRYHASAIWQKMHYIENSADIESILKEGITQNDGYGTAQPDFEGLMVRTEHNRYCLEQWLLDREDRGREYLGFKSYKSLKDMDDSSVVFPTKDQAMTMAIPFIINETLFKSKS